MTDEPIKVGVRPTPEDVDSIFDYELYDVVTGRHIKGISRQTILETEDDAAQVMVWLLLHDEEGDKYVELEDPLGVVTEDVHLPKYRERAGRPE